MLTLSAEELAERATIVIQFHILHRLGLEARGYLNIPESHTHVAKLVKDYANEVKQMNQDIVSKLMKQGYRFAVTMDEYTRLGNRKLSNINLHLPGGDFMRIGLVRVRGRMPAEICKKVLVEKLSEHGIEIKLDVVSHTTDGAR